MRTARILSTLIVLAGMLLGVTGQANSAQTPYRGIWLTAVELQELPTSGVAWDALRKAADASPGTPDISNQDSNNDVMVLAKALVYARTGETKYRDEVISNLKLAIGTEAGGRTLALGRNLVSYVIAADLINLPASDPVFEESFRTWLGKVRTETLDGRTLISTHEDRPNNWGTHAGASRIAADLYLGDTADLDRAATVFEGWLGDRDAYADFKYGSDLSWQCDASAPVGIDPDCTKDGFQLSGAQPEEMRRGGEFQYPPIRTGYAWEALQGALVQAVLLERAGYPAFSWSDNALLRAVQFLYNIGWEAEGDDEFSVWIINAAYGANYPAALPARHGKNMGWTDWAFSTMQGPVDPPPTVTPTTTATVTLAPPKITPTPTTTVTPTIEPFVIELVVYPPLAETPMRMICVPAP